MAGFGALMLLVAALDYSLQGRKTIAVREEMDAVDCCFIRSHHSLRIQQVG